MPNPALMRRALSLALSLALLLALAVTAYLLIRPEPRPSLSALARAGEVDLIYAMAEHQPDSAKDLETYKWLSVAEDFGHHRATAAIEDLREVSSLRHDDGELATSVVHHELGMAYLIASDGLPQDFALADKHFRLASRGMDGVQMKLDADRSQLSGEALKVFERFYPSTPASP